MTKSYEYLKTMVNTASPGKLVLMLYDAAIRNLNIVKDACINKDFEKKDIHIDKATKILTELLTSLNEEQGGEIAKNLKSIYLYIFRRLNEAGVKNDPEPVKEILNYLGELREAWRTIVRAEA